MTLPLIISVFLNNAKILQVGWYQLDVQTIGIHIKYISREKPAGVPRLYRPSLCTVSWSNHQ